jgi:hypothetical protein
MMPPLPLIPLEAEAVVEDHTDRDVGNCQRCLGVTPPDTICEMLSLAVSPRHALHVTPSDPSPSGGAYQSLEAS